MAEYNFWIGMSDGFQGELVPFILDGTPPVNFPMIGLMNEETKDFFRQSYDSGALDHLFRHYYVDPRDYRVWSFYVLKPDDVTPVRNNLDAMTTEYPQDFLIMGAWAFLTGQAVQAYPSPPSLINFMPLTWDHGTEPPTAIEPTELTDVNLLAGQAPREFI